MKKWKAQRTLLIVGEGRSEEAFLKHLKCLYNSRGCGLTIQIKNAKGKGAKHVVEWTAGQIANAHYDQAASLLDTDTDWSATVARFAHQKHIQVLKSEPCLEALLLRVLGRPDHGDAAQLKARFSEFVTDTTKQACYEPVFTDAILQTGRTKEPTLNELLKLFGA